MIGDRLGFRKAGRLVRGLGKNLFLRSNSSFLGVRKDDADDAKMVIDNSYCYR